ncbi:unnamed protein product [Arctogadus glacialis]
MPPCRCCSASSRERTPALISGLAGRLSRSTLEDGAMEGDDPPPDGECGTESQSGAPWRAALVNAINPLEVAPQDHDYFVLPVTGPRHKFEHTFFWYFLITCPL